MAGSYIHGGYRPVLDPQQDIYAQSLTAKHSLGEMLDTKIGGWSYRFVYARAAATALAHGVMHECPAYIADHYNCTVAVAVPAGDRVVTATLNGTTVTTANQYADGIMYVNDAGAATTTEGYPYAIKSNEAAGAGGVISVTLKDDILVALTVASQVSFYPNAYNGVVVVPNAGAASIAAGVPLINVTGTYYCWLCRRGPVACYCEGQAVVGDVVARGGTTDGACGPVSSSDVLDRWGVCIIPAVDTEYSLINLMLE